MPPSPAPCQVLRLADRLRAEPSLQSAVGALLAAGEPLTWDIALAVFELPAYCLESAAYAPLLGAATATLQARLGDLDAVWLNDSLSAQLLQLPFAAVRALLADDRTRGHENTAFYTVAAWVYARQGGGGGDGGAGAGAGAGSGDDDSGGSGGGGRGGGGGGSIGSGGGGGCSDEQRRTLVATLRLPHMSRMYLGAAAAQMLPALSAGSVPAEDICMAMAYAAAASCVKQRLDGPLLHKHTAWKLPARPASAAVGPTLEWDVPLSVIKGLQEKAAAGDVGAKAVAHSPMQCILQGGRWRLSVQAKKSEAGVTVGAFVHFTGPPGFDDVNEAQALARMKFTASRERTTTFIFEGSQGTISGYPDVFELGARTEFDEAAWSALATANGRVPLRAKFLEML